MPLINGEAEDRPTPIAFQFSGRIALIDNRYKLLHYGGGGPFARPPWNWHLYDMIEDPGERDDLAAKHPGIVKEMAEVLEQWNASVLASPWHLKKKQ